MSIRDEFIDILNLVHGENPVPRKGFWSYKRENERLWSLLLGMMVSNKATAEQLKKLLVK